MGIVYFLTSFFLLLSFEVSLHILDISSFSDIDKSISQSVACLLSFHLLNRMFHRTKILNFDVHFVDVSFRVKYKNA